MAAAIGLRSDYEAGELRRLAKASRDARQTRRLLALAVIYEGGSRTEAARVGGVTLQIVRDWVLRFNAEGPSGLVDRKAPGKAPLLQAEHRAALAAAVEAGPKPYLDGVVRGHLIDLAQWLGAVQPVGQPADAGAGAAGDGLCQALRPPAAPCAGSGGRGPVQKSLPDAVAAIRARLPAGTPVEMW